MQVAVCAFDSNYNAGQKKRNSDLRIFQAQHPPPGWRGLNFEHKVDLPLPGSSEKIHGLELRFF